MLPALPALLTSALAAANPAWPPHDPQTPAEALKRPENMPDDPDYRPHPDPTIGCGGQLALYSFTPDCTTKIGRAERDLLPASGIAVDRAWLWTIGRPEAVIAVADSGIDWSDRELVLRVRLNPGELPLPMTSSRTFSIYDANGDGVFNVQDYSTATGTVVPTLAMISDPRLYQRPDKGDANHNGILDPEDLIIAFSNGTDEDHNGYVDDIAGWDFLLNANDPRDPIPGSHGTARARDAVATANNGLGGAGACPACMLIPIRVSSGGVAPGSGLAQAIIFAVDSGANVIAALPSAAGASRLVQGAAAYAFSSGSVVVAPAGNASSLRQEVVWDPDQVLIVSGIGWNDTHLDRATTAVTPDPCSNFGPQVSLAAPARCGDENAAVVAGALGLLYSAAMGIPAKNVAPLSPALSAREALELAAATANDIPRLFTQDGSTAIRTNVAPIAPQPGVLIPISVAAGWDTRTGYGRADARRAIDALIQRRIPPEVEITSPSWLQMIDPSPISSFNVAGRVRNRRADSVSWVLDYAVGDSPAADGFSAIASGTVDRGMSADISGAVPTDSLFKDPTAPPDRPHAYAITLRLSASAIFGGTTVRGETRRVVFVHRDLEILPAFPVQLGAAVTASPRFVDLDGDGQEDILIATDDGTIHAIDGRGRPLTGWPVRAPLDPLIDPGNPRSHRASAAFAKKAAPSDTGAAILGAIAAAAPNTGKEDRGLVVAVTAEAQVLAFDAAGKPYDGFPLALTNTGTRSAPAHGPSSPLGVTQPPVLVDLNGDGRLDIVTALNDGTVHAIDQSAKELPGFPALLTERTGAPAVGDLDGDGKLDLVLAGAASIHIVLGNGMRGTIALPPRSVEARTDGLLLDPLPSPILSDLDGDGLPEIILSTRGRPVLVYRAEGGDPLRMTTADRAQIGAGSTALGMGEMIFAASGIGALANLAADGTAAVGAPCSASAALLGSDSEAAIEQLFCIWSLADGAFTIGAPYLMGDPAPGGAVIADVDGNGQPEIVVGDGDGRVEAFASDGTRPRRWPKLTGGWTQGAPALGDLGGDGLTDVAAATRSGLLFAWRTAGSTKRAPWPSFAHDIRGTGNAATPIAVFTHVDLGSGCACQSAAPSSTTFLVIAAVFLATRKRRRR